MYFYKKILIFIIIIVFTYILWRLIIRRQEILNKIQTNKNFVLEGGLFTTPTTEINNNKNSNPVLIENINPNYAFRPIREYVIKSSYNSAITGNYVNADMIKYLLGRGCRFFDFEIFYIKQTPVVAYSTDSTFNTIDTDNYILLDSILYTLVSNSFSSTSPNSRDPLFVQLRIKSNDPNIYNAVAKSIDYNLNGKLYNKQVTNDTKLSDIMGQIVIIMDKTINRNYSDMAMCTQKQENCYNLTKYINIESGSQTLFLQNYNELLNQVTNPPMIMDKCKDSAGKSLNICTNISNMRVVLPTNNFKNVKNPNYSYFVINFGCQIITYRFYILDNELKNYETFFDDNKTAFVPLAFAITYINKKNDSNFQ